MSRKRTVRVLSLTHTHSHSVFHKDKLSKPHPGKHAAASNWRLPRKPSDRFEDHLRIPTALPLTDFATFLLRQPETHFFSSK